MTNIKGAIFDVDGTLLDSMQMWDNVAADYLKSRGVTPRSNLNEELRTLGGHQISGYFRSEYGLPESEDEIRVGIEKLLQAFYFDSKIVKLKDGVVEVLEKLQMRGIKMCVATATDRWLIEPALRNCGIDQYFGRIFTCGEEETSKNHPDIYISAAEFLGTDIEDTLVFEDALYAIKSAKRAGFPVVGIYDSVAEGHQDEIERLCDIYLKSMASGGLRNFL